MFEDVSKPGDPRYFIHGTNIGVGEERDDRHVVAFVDKECDAIFQFELGKLFLKILHVLCLAKGGKKRKQKDVNQKPGPSVFKHECISPFKWLLGAVRGRTAPTLLAEEDHRRRPIEL